MSIKEKKKSIRFQLFSMLCITTVLTVLAMIVANSLFSELIFKQLKIKKSKEMCEKINQCYKSQRYFDLKNELERIDSKNDLGILIENQDEILYSNYKGIKYNINMIHQYGNNEVTYRDGNFLIHVFNDENVSNSNFILIEYSLDNGYYMYVRISLEVIHESINVINNCLIVIGLLLVLVFSIIAFILSKKISEPIMQLIDITSDMKRLNFGKKYRVRDFDGDINKLGNNINQISDKFEKTISHLRNNKNELEKGIEEQTRIDEMRQQFISDVSHELKTPISLIEGYAEGLIENVNEDEESRKFYAEVILDESKKMDKMVGELLELMKYEYEEIKLNDTEIVLTNIIEDEIRRENIVLTNNKILVEFKQKEPINIYADKKCTEQVVNNYLTNAIKHCERVNKEKKIIIRTENISNKVRLFVYNTGKKIPEEYKEKIWSRFFKIDSSRNRKDGGTGIGLAMVKAIMQNYNCEYGYKNYDEGVEFYCDFNINKSKDIKEK